MSMLKSLKNKKDGKGDPKKDSKKDKQTKKETKKVVKEEEEETNDVLVDIDYDQKEKPVPSKKINKIQSNKLEEKEINTANIVVQKKEEKKTLSTWVVEETEIQAKFREKFDMNKVDTDFQSLTDQKFNEQLAEKRKKQAAEKKNQVQQIGGFKYAPLENQNNLNRVDINEPLLKKPQRIDVNSNPKSQGIVGVAVNPPQFKNTGTGFVPLEKTAQQLKEQELEKKMEASRQAPVKSAWLGKKTETAPQVQVPQPQEFKVSAWAQKAQEDKNVAPVKFVPLQKSDVEKRFQRSEQEYVFVSKKEQEQRRKKREQAEKTTKV